MTQAAIVTAWIFLSKIPTENGGVQYTEQFTTYLGEKSTRSGTAGPEITDLDAMLASDAQAYAAQLVNDEATQAVSDIAGTPLSQTPEIPATLKYATTADVIGQLRAAYQDAEGDAMLNLAVVLAAQADSDLRIAFGLSDVTELRSRLTRQSGIRTTLSAEKGE